MNSINERDIYFINEKKRIIGELLRSEQIEPGQLINYAQFSSLYAPYRYSMNEREFVQTLEINQGSFYQMKHEGGKGRVLRELKKELERIKEKQKTDLEQACIEMLNKYNELGLTKGQALKRTEEMLGISPEEMLKVMQDYQTEQKEIKVVPKEGVILGEERN